MLIKKNITLLTQLYKKRGITIRALKKEAQTYYVF